MYALSIFDDYSEGCHPSILDTWRTNTYEQSAGYGEDQFTIAAVKLLREYIGHGDPDIHFVSAGTQANLILLAAALKPYESVIAVDSGHINIHEAGAVEATGHKITTVPHVNGKLTPEAIRNVCAFHTDEHMVKPRVAYISQTTEFGTIYSKQELQELSAACKELGLYFYLDGARLGSALTARTSDATLSDIARCVDAFYIGGTKNGALFGEALVINHPDLQDHFRHFLKQRGAILAKGRAVSLQFQTLFTDNLYFDLARHANAMAELLADGISATGYTFWIPPESNQLFPRFPNDLITNLQKEFGFYMWTKGDKESVIRLVTSWATPEEKVRAFIGRLKS